ncbi:MAG TPA: heavy metal translocating P-type ATPase metal-binding domain-containing protein, partial [Leptospiraceae bacterium]|nr:heavy metal translocating P-type ATPase metal-binding domain-containing protein [Leptospiraceae bacterium]
MSARPSAAVQNFCAHCGNLIEGKEIVSKETGKLFCCEGCRSVSSLIDRLGKGHFYNIKGPAKIGRVSLTQADDAYLDHDSVMKKFTTPAGGSNMEVIVEIRNIHCSACV